MAASRKASCRWRAIKAPWCEPVGQAQFEGPCQGYAGDFPAWCTDLRETLRHYLALLKYPGAVRRSSPATDQVEAVNGQLEILLGNSGGCCHHKNTLKLGLAGSRRHEGRS